MASGGLKRITALGLIVVAIGAGGYWLSRPEPTPPIVGVVRTTEVRIAPEVGGQLAAIKVHKGDTVHAGDVVAELSAIELTASVGQARAALAAATADRNNVYAGVRAEQVASLAAEIAKAKSRLEYAEQQLSRTTYLARSETASQQALDQAQNDARAHVPTLPRRKPTTTPRSPGRPKRSVPSRTRRSRRRRPRSRCLNGGSTRPSCGLRLTALSV
jgi:multidrug resistance efflux pump